MKKYTYKKGSKPKIPASEIAKMKDFEGLKTNYQRAVHDIHRKPVYKNPRFFFGLLMVILIAYILFEMSDKEQQTKNQKTPEHSTVPEQ